MLRNIKKSLINLMRKKKEESEPDQPKGNKKEKAAYEMKERRKRSKKKRDKEALIKRRAKEADKKARRSAKTPQGLAKIEGLIKLGGKRGQYNYASIKDIKEDFREYLSTKSLNFLQMNKYCLIIFFIDGVFNKKYNQCMPGEGYDIIEKYLRPVKKKFLSDREIFLN